MRVCILALGIQHANPIFSASYYIVLQRLFGALTAITAGESATRRSPNDVHARRSFSSFQHGRLRICGRYLSERWSFLLAYSFLYLPLSLSPGNGSDYSSARLQ